MKNIFLITIFLFSISNCLAQTDNEEIDWMQWKYIVIAGASSDFNALDNLSKSISTKTGIEYSNDLIYAGSYYPRREDTSRISIEMMWYVSKGNMQNVDTTKMVIVTGIFDFKKSALNQLQKVQEIVPTAYIKKMKLYMGCMH